MAIHSVDHDEYPEFTEWVEVPLTAKEFETIKALAKESGRGPILLLRNMARMAIRAYEAHLQKSEELKP